MTAARTPPRLPNQSTRPGQSAQRPNVHPGPVQGLQSKRQPLPRREAMAPTNLFFDTPPGAVSVDGMQPGSVTGDVIDAATITGNNIVGGTITGDLIAANTITGDHLVAGSIDAGDIIASGSITADMLAANSVTTDKLAAGSVTTPKIAAGAVTADRISVTQLSAITADMGTLTAGTIQGGTIIGGTIQGTTITGVNISASTFTGNVFETAAANPKVRIDATGIRMTAVDGTTTFYADASTGVLTLGNPAGSKITFDPALATMQRLYLEGRLVGTGTIMGPSFITGLTNPRMVIDAFGIRAYPAGAFPSTAVLDDFNRANTGPPPSASWVSDIRSSMSPALAVRSNMAQALTLAPEASMYWGLPATTDDNEAFVTLQADQQVEVWARRLLQSGFVTAYVVWYRNSDHTLRIQKYGPGGGAWVDLTSPVDCPYTAGMSIGVRVVGTSITAFWKATPAGVWQQVAQVTDTSFTTGKDFGVVVYSTSALLDDFGGGDYVPSGGGTPTFSVDSASGTVTIKGGSVNADAVMTDTADPRIVLDTYLSGGVEYGRLRATSLGGAAYLTVDQGVVTMTSVAITGGTITGATTQSAGSNPSVRLSPAGLESFDAGGQRYVYFAPDAAPILRTRTGGTGNRIEFDGVNGLQMFSVTGSPAFQLPIGGSGYATATGMVMQGTDLHDLQGAAVNRKLASVNTNYLGAGSEVCFIQSDQTGTGGLWFKGTSWMESSAVFQTGPWTRVETRNSLAMVRYFSGAAGQDSRMILDASGWQWWWDTAQTIGFRIHPTTGPSYVAVPANTRWRMGEGVGGANQPVDVINGYIIPYGAAIGSGQAYNIECGMKGVAAAAGASIGYQVSPRAFRTDSSAAPVTPASATLATPFLQSNNQSMVVNTLRPMSFQHTYTAVAAGACYCYQQVTVN